MKYFIFLFFFVINHCFAVDYYWVGNAGNWSDFATHWATTSGGTTFHTQAPTATDNVFFDNNSFTLAGQTVLVDVASHCNHISWTGVLNNPTFHGNFQTLNIYGSMTLVAGMNTLNEQFYFRGTSLGLIADFANKPIDYPVFWGSGEYTLLSGTVSQYFTHYAGILNTNGFNISATRFECSGALVRTLNLGNSTITVNTWQGYNFSGSNLTLNAGTSTLNCSPATNNYCNFNASAIGLVFNTINFNGVCVSYGSFSVNAMNLGSGSTLYQGSNLTILNSLNGPAGCNMATIQSSNPGTVVSILKSSGTVAVSNLQLFDIQAAGGATFDLSNGILQNSPGWNLVSARPPQIFYWIGNGGNWADGTHWSLSTGGPAANCLPTSVDSVVFNNNSFSISNQTVSLTVRGEALCKGMAWTTTRTPRFDISDPYCRLRIYGSLRLASGMQILPKSAVGSAPIGANGSSFEMLGTDPNLTITSNGVTIPILIINGTGTFTLQDALNCTQPYLVANLQISKGNFITNNKSVFARYASIGGAAVTLNFGNSILTFAERLNIFAPSPVTSNYKIIMNNGAGTTILDPNSVNLNVVQFSSAINRINNASTYDSIIVDAGKTIQFRNGFTHTVNQIVALGTSGSPVVIQSYTAGSQAFIQKTSGQICLDWVQMRDIRGNGAAIFNAGLNSTNVSNNTNWIFAQPCITYVKWNATGANNGTSWNDAYTSLSTAIANTGYGQIWVAAGTYKPENYTFDCSNCVNSRNFTFPLRNDVTIYGGFAGNEISLGARNITANLTILDGDIDHDGITNNGNVYNVVTTLNDNNTAVLDGFTIQNGNANGSTVFSAESPVASIFSMAGGGINSFNSSAVIRNCTIQNCLSPVAGGVYSRQGAQIYQDCLFKNNNSVGLEIVFGANITIERCVFENNISNNYGGGVYNNANAIIRDCIFLNNSAIRGGGISNYSGSSTSIINSVFVGNTATAEGGAVHNTFYPSAVNITNGTFYNNSAPLGSFLFNWGSNATVSNSIIWGNTGTLVGNSNGGANPVINYSIVEGGYSGTGILNADPMFVKPNVPKGADNLFRTADDGLKFIFGSPAINAGSPSISTPTTDVTGDLRGLAPFDLGAYEGPTLALPVEYESFTAIRQDQEHAILNWKTASEKNNQGFEVFRKFDFEVEFSNIGFVYADSDQNYQFIDENHHAGISYYQLKQLDFNGNSSISEIKEVVGWDTFEVKIYPNPFENEMVIEAPAGSKVEIVNTLGVTIVNGLDLKKINTNHWSSGIYFVKITNQEKVIVKRLIKNN